MSRRGGAERPEPRPEVQIIEAVQQHLARQHGGELDPAVARLARERVRQLLREWHDRDMVELVVLELAERDGLEFARGLHRT